MKRERKKIEKEKNKIVANNASSRDYGVTET